MISNPICLLVKGPFACFTRPEFKVERVSYPVITPSAARGIFEAILMKPIEKPDPARRQNKVGFRWWIMKMGIVSKGTMFSLVRNELGYESDSHPWDGCDISSSANRAQRNSLILHNVEYLLEGRIEVADQISRRRGQRHFDFRGTLELLAKYHHSFLRRALCGQCAYQPFLGCREFSVSDWECLTKTEKGDYTLKPATSARLSKMAGEDFGMIFQDFDYANLWDHWRAESGLDYAPRPTEWPEKTRLRALPGVPAKCDEDGWIHVARMSADGKKVQPLFARSAP